MSEKTPELIVCAAIKFAVFTATTEPKKVREIVVTGVRHYSSDMRSLMEEFDDYYDYKEIVQGFLTNHGRFVDRKEALKIAKANNQIRYSIGYDPNWLFSEMLY